jgi:hypothetical protein
MLASLYFTFFGQNWWLALVDFGSQHFDVEGLVQYIILDSPSTL